MENKIYIRTFFSDFKEVTREQAKEHFENLRKGIINLNENEKNEFCNKFVKGITIEELLKEKEVE